MNRNENFPSLEERATAPFLYLEKLVKYSFAPENVIGKEADTELMDEVIRKLEQKREEIEDNIRSCSLLSENDDLALTRLITRYYGNLVALLERCGINKQVLENSHSPYAQLYPEIMQCILDIVSYIETEYGDYKSPDERIHPMHLVVIRDEVEALTGQILADEGNRDSPVHGFVTGRLRKFLVMDGKVSLRSARYHQQLALKVSELSWNKMDLAAPLTKIDEILVFLNFNSIEYLQYLTGRISAAVQNSPDMMWQLLLLQKKFNQLPKKPGMALNENFTSLSEYMGNWFREEIAFMEKHNGAQVDQSPVEVRPEAETVAAEKQEMTIDKILCKVSTDQIAIIFRALYMSGLLIFPSVTKMFEIIAKYLSTTKRNDLSFKSLRTKSYSPEENEKKKAKAILQKLIQEIDEM